jgi:hypothetical protein
MLEAPSAGLVVGEPAVYAAGEATSFPLRQGGSRRSRPTPSPRRSRPSASPGSRDAARALAPERRPTLALSATP